MRVSHKWFEWISCRTTHHIIHFFPILSTSSFSSIDASLVMKFLKTILRHALHQNAHWLIWREDLRSHLIEWNFDVYYYRFVAASQMIFCCDRQMNECMASPGHNFYYRTVIELRVHTKNAEKWTRMEYAINGTMKFRAARNFTNEQLCKYVPTERRTGIRVAICGACNAYIRFACHIHTRKVCLDLWLASMCAATVTQMGMRRGRRCRSSVLYSVWRVLKSIADVTDETSPQKKTSFHCGATSPTLNVCMQLVCSNIYISLFGLYHIVAQNTCWGTPNWLHYHFEAILFFGILCAHLIWEYIYIYFRFVQIFNGIVDGQFVSCQPNSSQI